MTGQRRSPSFLRGPKMWLSGLLFGLAKICAGFLQRRIAFHHVLGLRPDDIYLATWPGSGEEVLLMMLHQLKSDGEENFPHIDSKALPLDHLVDSGHAEILTNQTTPRLFKTYWYPELAPKKGRFVVLIRQPEDVAEASVQRHCLLGGTDEARESALDAFLSGYTRFASWFDHTRLWWACRTRENVLILSYEEVLKDLEGTARKVAEHCGLAADEERIARAAERSHLDSLAQDRDRFDPRLRRIDGEPGTSFIRQGKSGGGKEAIRGEHAALLKKRLQILEDQLEGTEEESFRRLVTF